MASDGFWDDQASAQKTVSELSSLRALVAPLLKLKASIGDLDALFELAEESDEDPALAADLSREAADLSALLDRVEIESFLSGPHDKCNAILTIHAGAGGTESCDWAEMLLRMATRPPLRTCSPARRPVFRESPSE